MSVCFLSVDTSGEVSLRLGYNFSLGFFGPPGLAGLVRVLDLSVLKAGCIVVEGGSLGGGGFAGGTFLTVGAGLDPPSKSVVCGLTGR